MLLVLLWIALCQLEGSIAHTLHQLTGMPSCTWRHAILAGPPSRALLTLRLRLISCRLPRQREGQRFGALGKVCQRLAIVHFIVTADNIGAQVLGAVTLNEDANPQGFPQVAHIACKEVALSCSIAWGRVGGSGEWELAARQEAPLAGAAGR